MGCERTMGKQVKDSNLNEKIRRVGMRRIGMELACLTSNKVL